jgi:hypothetical protein
MFKATIGDYDNVIGSRSFDNLDSAEIQAEKWLHNLGREHALVESVICLITVQRHDSVNDSWHIVSEFEH